MDELIDAFYQEELLLKVALQPSCSSIPLEAVKCQLNNLLFKYSENLKGVPLAYSGLNFPKGKQCARIMSDQFWLHVDVCTTLLVFRPVVGQRIRGRVTNVTSSNVGILVLGLFNASLNGIEVAEKYSFNVLTKEWESANGDIKDGDEVNFAVASVQHANGILHINGIL